MRSPELPTAPPIDDDDSITKVEPITIRCGARNLLNADGVARFCTIVHDQLVRERSYVS